MKWAKTYSLIKVKVEVCIVRKQYVMQVNALRQMRGNVEKQKKKSSILFLCALFFFYDLHLGYCVFYDPKTKRE